MVTCGCDSQGSDEQLVGHRDAGSTDGGSDDAGSHPDASKAFTNLGAYLYRPYFNSYVGTDEQLVSEIQQTGVNTVFLSIEHWSLDEQTYQNRLRGFIAEAHRSEVYVHALCLQTADYLDDFQSAIDVINQVVDFNDESAPDEKLDGIRINVEPVTHANWDNSEYGIGGERDQLMLKLVDLMRVVYEASNGRGLLLSSGVDIFYYNRKLSGDLSVGSPDDFLTYNDFLVYMDYTDNVSEIIDWVDEEIDDASYPDSYTVALKCKPDEDAPDTTFYDEGWSAYMAAIDGVLTTFSSSDSFLGAVVFKYSSLRDLYVASIARAPNQP